MCFGVTLFFMGGGEGSDSTEEPAAQVPAPAAEPDAIAAAKAEGRYVENVVLSNFYTDENGKQQHDDFTYTGYVDHGKANGRGRGVYQECVYEGEYKDNDFGGEGRLEMTAGATKGSIYKGQWQAGFLTQGSFYDAETNRTFVGTFDHSEPAKGQWAAGNLVK